jgi:hypothetical protein
MDAGASVGNNGGMIGATMTQQNVNLAVNGGLHYNL